MCDSYSGTIFESGESTLRFNNEAETFYDADFLECLEHMEGLRIFSPVVRTVPADRRDPSGDSVKLLTYFYFEPYYGTAEERNNIIAINVSISWMQEALGYFHGANPDASGIEIVSKSGQILFSEEEDLIGTQYADGDVLNRIWESGRDYGYLVEKGNRGRLLTFSRSAFPGYEDWIFLSSSDLGTVMKPVRDMKALVYSVAGAVLVISILGLVMALQRFGAPIRQAFHKAQMLEREQQEKQKREAAEYMKRLLEGDIEADHKSVREMFGRLHIPYDSDRENRLVLISLDDQGSLRRRFRNRWPEILLRAEEMIRDSFDRYYDCKIAVRKEDGSIIMVLCLPEKEPEGRMEELFDVIGDGIGRELHGTVSVSVSSRGQSVEDLPFLLAEVMEIHTYRYLYGYGKMLDAGVLKNRSQESYVYPKEIEREILACLFAGKQKETEAAYESWIEALSANGGSSIFDQGRHFALHDSGRAVYRGGKSAQSLVTAHAGY